MCVVEVQLPFSFVVLSPSWNKTSLHSVTNFLRRSQKLSILNGLKHSQPENRLSFPMHHKHKSEHSSTSKNLLHEIDTLDIERLISNAYDQAVHIIEHSRIFSALEQHNLNNLVDISATFDQISPRTAGQILLSPKYVAF